MQGSRPLNSLCRRREDAYELTAARNPLKVGNDPDQSIFYISGIVTPAWGGCWHGTRPTDGTDRGDIRILQRPSTEQVVAWVSPAINQPDHPSNLLRSGRPKLLRRCRTEARKEPAFRKGTSGERGPLRMRTRPPRKMLGKTHSTGDIRQYQPTCPTEPTPGSSGRTLAVRSR
jgi:hypothetical protein